MLSRKQVREENLWGLMESLGLQGEEKYLALNRGHSLNPLLAPFEDDEECNCGIFELIVCTLLYIESSQ